MSRTLQTSTVFFSRVSYLFECNANDTYVLRMTHMSVCLRHRQTLAFSTTSSADNDDEDDVFFYYFNYVQRRQRRDVDDVVVRVGSRRLDEDDVGSRRRHRQTLAQRRTHTDTL